jgi:hypothetical protein
VRLATIVEGHGDAEAAPELIRRIAASLSREVEALRPIRIPRQRLLKAGELERTVEFSARHAGSGGGVLILLDADNDCPAELATELLARARGIRSDREIRAVLAKTEFEAWFLASAASLRGKRGLRSDLAPPDDPESIRDAKGWLSSAMRDGRSYREVLDQPAVAAMMDLNEARRAPSFDKFWRDVESLLGN